MISAGLLDIVAHCVWVLPLMQKTKNRLTHFFFLLLHILSRAEQLDCISPHLIKEYIPKQLKILLSSVTSHIETVEYMLFLIWSFILLVDLFRIRWQLCTVCTVFSHDCASFFLICLFSKTTFLNLRLDTRSCSFPSNHKRLGIMSALTPAYLWMVDALGTASSWEALSLWCVRRVSSRLRGLTPSHAIWRMGRLCGVDSSPNAKVLKLNTF